MRAAGPRSGRGAALALALVAALFAAGCGGGGSEAASTPAPSSAAAGITATPSSFGEAAGPAPEVAAWSGILIDRRSGEVLWAKDPDRELEPASCTKIMTALLVLEQVADLDEYATVPPVELPTIVGVGLMPGDRITVREALLALVVKSANDAAYTLSWHVAGSEDAFVALMNRRAKQLGLTHTRFVNSRGTPMRGHYSSARDLATLGRYAMRDPVFRRLVARKRAVVHYPPDVAVPVESHNRLLDHPWGDGIKTGATKSSGAVLVGAAHFGAEQLIVVTMHQPSRDREERDALALLEWGAALLQGRGDAPSSPSP